MTGTLRLAAGGLVDRGRPIGFSFDGSSYRGLAGDSEGWLTVGPPLSIPDKAARIIAAPGGERIAVFRDGTQVGALSNLCAHQNGPLGEGRVIDGCVTCPWHGYQYRPEDGCSPPPGWRPTPTSERSSSRPTWRAGSSITRRSRSKAQEGGR